eukprot:scaffold786_cov87-Isochrysis_galbana.AAC.2
MCAAAPPRIPAVFESRTCAAWLQSPPFFPPGPGSCVPGAKAVGGRHRAAAVPACAAPVAQRQHPAHMREGEGWSAARRGEGVVQVGVVVAPVGLRLDGLFTASSQQAGARWVRGNEEGHARSCLGAGRRWRPVRRRVGCRAGVPTAPAGLV